MTKIYNTDTRETAELSLFSDGQEFLFEVIGGCNQDGRYYSEDMPEEADFAMSSDDIDWWENWSTREQAIIDKANELGEEAIDGISRLAGKYSDMEELQQACCEFLGI